MGRYSTKQFGRLLSSEENKAVQLNILRFVANYCEKHGLRYFLADGTLLGAIRHKGFIPWDDDIDIRMPRPDLIRIVDRFNKDSGSNRYVLVSPTMKMAQHYMVKIIDTETIKIEPYLDYSNGFLGVDIDVFPLDGCPKDESEFYKWGKQIRLLNKAYAYKKRILWRSILSYSKDIVYRRNRAKLCPFTSASKIAEKVKTISLQYPYESSDYICCMGIGDKFRVPRACYDNYTLLPFEGEAFRVPVGYDAVLRAQYGNYMELPPQEKQITHHVNAAYWKREE